MKIIANELIAVRVFECKFVYMFVCIDRKKGWKIGIQVDLVMNMRTNEDKIEEKI